MAFNYQTEKYSFLPGIPLNEQYLPELDVLMTSKVSETT